MIFETSDPQILSYMEEEDARSMAPGEKDENEFYFVGTAVGVVNFGHGIKIRLALNSNDVERPHVSITTVDFYGVEAIDAISKAVIPENRPRVVIRGYIRTRRRDEADGVHYYQDLIGVNIDFAPSMMESAFKTKGIGFRKAPGVNLVKLCGEVVNIFVRRRPNGTPICSIISMKTIVHGKLYMPKVVFFKFQDVISQLLPGDRMFVLGESYVKMDDSGEKRIYLDSIVGQELQRVGSLTARSPQPRAGRQANVRRNRTSANGQNPRKRAADNQPANGHEIKTIPQSARSAPAPAAPKETANPARSHRRRRGNQSN